MGRCCENNVAVGSLERVSDGVEVKDAYVMYVMCLARLHNHRQPCTTIFSRDLLRGRHLYPWITTPIIVAVKLYTEHNIASVPASNIAPDGDSL
jgi:hypothetical protein